MAYDSVRAQLDKLLGPDRNGPLTAPNATPVSYTSPSVCKHYLLGFCPNDLSIKHRSEPGSCPRQHPPAARAAFETDRAAGKLQSEVVSWTRALLAECRAILADEERRIRGNARRLQETYSATGNLNGLMIRNFDTLKALGMVSKDAKIRVFSEMENADELFGARPVDHDAMAVQDEEELEIKPIVSDLQPDVKGEKAKPEVISEKAPIEGKEVTQKAEQGEAGANDDDEDDDEDSDGNNGDNDDNIDDDDLDGFGVIKVIPAAASEAPKVNAEKEQQIPSGDDVKQADEGTEGKTMEVLIPSKQEQPKEDAPKKDSVADSTKKQADPKGGEEVNGNPSTSPKPAVKDEGEEPKLDSKAKANETEDKMEEFYRRGIGPDGLLMLDRKQSKRVCALCGGYISLVDAESRLLSHYGGKSHQSLVQLREKVAELEKEVAAQRAHDDSAGGREYHRGRRDLRENRWSRGDERGPRGWERHRGRYDRDRERRGHGTTDWYSGWQHGRDGDRGTSDDYYRRERDSGRYGSGRKRYRSRSPNRSSRRYRNRY